MLDEAGTPVLENMKTSFEVVNFGVKYLSNFNLYNTKFYNRQHINVPTYKSYIIRLFRVKFSYIFDEKNICGFLFMM